MGVEDKEEVSVVAAGGADAGGRTCNAPPVNWFYWYGLEEFWGNFQEKVANTEILRDGRDQSM